MPVDRPIETEQDRIRPIGTTWGRPTDRTAPRASLRVPSHESIAAFPSIRHSRSVTQSLTLRIGIITDRKSVGYGKRENTGGRPLREEKGCNRVRGGEHRE